TTERREHSSAGRGERVAPASRKAQRRADCQADGDIIRAMSSFEGRAHARRASWTGGRARSMEELEEADRSFWSEASPSQRLTAVWQMADESLAMKGLNEPSSGLQGSAFSVRRRGRPVPPGRGVRRGVS